VTTGAQLAPELALLSFVNSSGAYPPVRRPSPDVQVWRTVTTCKQSGNRGAGRFRSSRRDWHTQPMNALWLTLLLAAPWLAALAYTWSRAPRMDGPPPSTAERTRERLWH